MVEDLSFEVKPGQSVGLLGESGSGKTMTALAALGMVPEPHRLFGRVTWRGESLSEMSERRLCRLRGAEIAMVFQEPGGALDPTMRVGRQVAEAYQIHHPRERQEAQRRTAALFEELGLGEARTRCYPHQLSGGMQQRVLLAAALIAGPDLIIADEPTTALDMTLQQQVMDRLQRARREGAALLLISHDLALVGQQCDRLVILYAGRVVEQGPARACLLRPRHPYTAALLRSMRSLQRGELRAVPATESSPKGLAGSEGLGAPAASAPDEGCSFAGRCGRRQPACEEASPPLSSEDHAVRCFFPEASDGGDDGAA